MEETLEAKAAFQQYASDKHITIKAYHADNGIFRANKWQIACKNERQQLTFAGVNAHHTNGLAEKRIRDLQDLTRTQLIYAASKWKNCITANLWPYAMRMANEALNNTSSLQDKHRRTPMQVFTSTQVNINAKHYKPFGCPTFVLHTALQTNQPFHKWKQRSQVGMYLGQSPHHGRNVSLVLNLTTGLVSPQFHVKHDPTFGILQQEKIKSSWLQKAGLKASNKHINTQSEETEFPRSIPPNATLHKQHVVPPRNKHSYEYKRRSNFAHQSDVKNQKSVTFA
jgi:hypothetical protein